MKKYVGLSFILALGFSFLLGALPVRGDEYSETGTWINTGEERELFYNVTESGNDAFLRIGLGFSATAEIQPFRSSTYDIIGALVFDIPDRVYNATHRESPYLAWLEVWSNDQTMLPTGSMTFYQINASEIGPYTNYTELYDAPYPYHVGNVPMLEFGRHSNPSGWEGWRGASLRSLENALNRVNNPYYASMDNDTLGLKYLTVKGRGQHFSSYDANSSRAPRIGVIWRMYEWMEATAPDGYTGDDFIKKYRGFYIWDRQPGGWFNYSEFTISGPDSGIISNLNDTYFDFSAYRQESDINMWKLFVDDGTGIVNRKWGVKLTQIAVSPPPTQGYLGFVGWSDTLDKAVSGNPQKWGNGYILESHVFEGAPEYNVWRMWSVEGNVIRDMDEASPAFNDDLPYTLWFDLSLDMNTGDFNLTTYNDIEMTSLNSTFADNLDPIEPYSKDIFPYEFVMAGWTDQSAIQPVHSGAFLSKAEGIGVLVTDRDGIVIPGFECETVECAEYLIDQALSSLNPEYDALPNLGSTIMLLMGLLGVIAIPGGFIVMGMSIRSGNWEEGFYYLLVMFFVGLAFVTAWLFG